MKQATTDARDTFRSAFDADPTHRVRAPGRVNLIGEHVDYVGLPVFPVALTRRVSLVLRPRQDAAVRIVNIEPAFGERSFELEAEPPRAPDGDWENYLKAAARDRVRAHGPLRGFDAVLASDVPVAGGVSSSAALVVAMAVAIELVNGKHTPTLELATALAHAERFVGTQGGGMDQAISLGARAGHAALIGFEPLRMQHVPIPDGWRFVVANTLVRAEKSGPAQQAYNDRTRACAAALDRIRVALREDEDAGYPELLERHEPGTLLEAGDAVLDDTLLRRFRHVVTEGRRVHEARAAMEAADLARFGELMNASHTSLRDDYEVSSAELDRLVELARSAGAAGARLTGAGFGGCIVALCPEGRAEAVMDALERGYYADLPDPGPRSARLFPVDPGAGAAELVATAAV